MQYTYSLKQQVPEDNGVHHCASLKTGTNGSQPQLITYGYSIHSQIVNMKIRRKEAVKLLSDWRYLLRVYPKSYTLEKWHMEESYYGDYESYVTDWEINPHW